MAALKSTQETNRAAGVKMLPNVSTGKRRSAYGRIVLAAAGVVGDTIDFCIIPKGARISHFGAVNCSTGTASSTLDLGLKSLKTGVVIDADGVAAAVAIATAGHKTANNGALIANGEEYVTTEDVVLYGTIAGANAPSGQKIIVDVPYVTD